MNALTRTVSSAVPRAVAMQRRLATTGSFQEPTFKQSWLSDVSTYPIMVILGFACTGCAAFMARTLFFHPDVRIAPGKTKGQIVRTWG